MTNPGAFPKAGPTSSRHFRVRAARAIPQLVSGFRKRGRRNGVASDFSSVFLPIFSVFLPFNSLLKYLPFSSIFIRFHFSIFFFFSGSSFFRFLPFHFQKKRGDRFARHLLRNPDLGARENLRRPYFRWNGRSISRLWWSQCRCRQCHCSRFPRAVSPWRVWRVLW